MIRLLNIFLAGVILMATLARGDNTPASLEIRVVDGEGASYLVGSRATRGVTVLVSDETGRPVNGAVVSFSLPGDGPSGVFASGSRTEIMTTRADGRAAVWGMQWNRTAGRFEIRIAAGKREAHAAIVSAQYLTNLPEDSRAAASASVRTASSSGGHKLLWIALVAGGAAAAAVAGLASGKSATPAAAAAASSSVTQIGTPTISLGRP